MFKKNLTLTLLVYLVAIFAISSFVEARDFDSPHRRDHENLNRLMKKRASTPLVLGGVENDPSATDSAASAASTSSASTTAATSASLSSASATSASSSSSSSASQSSTSSSSSVSSSSSSASSSVSSTSGSSSVSSVSTTASTSTSSSTAQPTSTFSSHSQESPSTRTSVISGTLVTLTESVASSSTPTSDASVSGATSESPKSAGLTVLIVIAASIGGITILWTIFRKWKLGRSSKFDHRLQPINWQNPATEDSGLPTHRRRASDTSSFHSGMQGGASDLGHGMQGGASDLGHGSSDNGHGTYGAVDLPPLPAHDFTAAPANLAPVGGYADLARGPSPQPQMQEALTRGPSLTHHYDPNVPLHHQTGYSATQGY